MEASHRSGVPGTGPTGVPEGASDNRDRVITSTETPSNRRFTVCYARAAGKAPALDLRAERQGLRTAERETPMAVKLPPRLEQAVRGITEEALALRKITREEWGAFLEWRVSRDGASPAVGDPAPDVELEIIDADAGRTGEYRRLSSYRGTPVGLIFGSITCPPHRRALGRLDALAVTYRDHVEFVYIYTREAHPADGQQVGDNVREGYVYDDHKTADERGHLARTCKVSLAPSIPMLIDNMENEAELKYVAAPERLYVIGANGRITYKGGLGPWYFDVDRFEEALKDALAETTAREDA